MDVNKILNMIGTFWFKKHWIHGMTKSELAYTSQRWLQRTLSCSWVCQFFISSSLYCCSIEESKYNWHILLPPGWVIKRRKLTICPDQSEDSCRFACEGKSPCLQAVARPTRLLTSDGRTREDAELRPELLSNRPYSIF